MSALKKEVMKFLNIKSILICLMVGSSLHSELLIVKQVFKGFASLSQEESIRYNDVIAEIMLKYQWPMCIGSDLSDDEKNELFAQDQAWEELFIQEKLQRKIPRLNLQVVFIPTCLYELFCVVKNYAQQANPLNTCAFQDNEVAVDFFALLGREDLSARQVRSEIQDTFKKINNVIFKKQNKQAALLDNESKLIPSAYLYVNNQLFDELSNEFSEIHACKNGQEISNFFQNNTGRVFEFLVKQISALSFDENDKYHDETVSYLKCFLKSEHNESKNKMVENVVRLEYEARKANKAMLLRGSNLEEMDVSMGKEPTKKFLIGNTLYQEFEDLPVDEKSKNSGDMDQDYDDAARGPEIPFWKKYKEKSNVPYSISFGTSLFAGLINDPAACAYSYLSGCGEFVQKPDSTVVMPVGYAVFINKKDYIEHQNFNLFYIPSLSTIASLFEQGEWFHARAKAAIAIKKEEVVVEGAWWKPIKDPTGVLLITRDPLKHAELFSKFLITNGHLIQPGNESMLTQGEKIFVERVMENQKKAADLYKVVRTFKPKVDKAVEKFRNEKELRKAKEKAQKEAEKLAREKEKSRKADEKNAEKKRKAFEKNAKITEKKVKKEDPTINREQLEKIVELCRAVKNSEKQKITKVARVVKALSAHARRRP
jgi:hypothetical protein